LQILFHLSEDGGIERFDPRPSDYTSYPVVWAISGDRMCNYLVPRECPRVTYYAGPKTTTEDVDRFLGGSNAVVAVEAQWLERIRNVRLFCYHLPKATFECLDACAGYFVSRIPVVPERVEVFDDLISQFPKRKVELRFVPELWTLRDAVIASTLEFSIIRMRNAGAPAVRV
jgi:hypothetical protein